MGDFITISTPVKLLRSMQKVLKIIVDPGNNKFDGSIYNTSNSCVTEIIIIISGILLVCVIIILWVF